MTLFRSDMMRSDGSFLQNSSLPLIHPYQRGNPSSYSTPLMPPRILELTSQANRAVLIKDHLASVQISLIECQSRMFAWQQQQQRQADGSGGAKLGHRLRDHCLAHIKAFVLARYETLGGGNDNLLYLSA